MKGMGGGWGTSASAQVENISQGDMTWGVVSLIEATVTHASTRSRNMARYLPLSPTGFMFCRFSMRTVTASG